MSPYETDEWIRAIDDKRSREDQLVARIGYFLYTSKGAKKKGGGSWKERDFMPRRPPSEKQIAIMTQVEAMKMQAAQRRKEKQPDGSP